MAEGKGKYLNAEKRKVYETMMAKSEQLTAALEKGDIKAAQKLAVEVKALKVLLDSSKGRRNILKVTPEEALKMDLADNESIVIIRTVKGTQITKCGLPKSKRVSADIRDIWPEAKPNVTPEAKTKKAAVA